MTSLSRVSCPACGRLVRLGFNFLGKYYVGGHYPLVLPGEVSGPCEGSLQEIEFNIRFEFEHGEDW